MPPRLFLVALLLVWGAVAGRAAPLAPAGEVYAYLGRDDGTVRRYRVDSQTGKFLPLSGVVDTGIHAPIEMELSPDSRFVYIYHRFDINRDGYDGLHLEERGFTLADGERMRRAAESRPTVITVWAVGAAGVLRQVQTLTLPGPVGQLLPRPDGKFLIALTIGKAFLLRTTGDGSLVRAGDLPIETHMTTMQSEWTHYNYLLTFAPTSRYLYVFSEASGPHDAVGRLLRFRVDPATCGVAQDGDGWPDSRSNANNVSRGYGPVQLIVNHMAFVADPTSFPAGCWVCRVNAAGRILSKGSVAALKSNMVGRDYDATMTPHPTKPLVFCRTREIWRVVAPGKVVKVGKLPVLGEDKGWLDSFDFDPTGTFLYETTHIYLNAVVGGHGEENRYFRSIWKLNRSGTRARLAQPSLRVPADETTPLFILVPRKGRGR